MLDIKINGVMLANVDNATLLRVEKAVKSGHGYRITSNTIGRTMADVLLRIEIEHIARSLGEII